MARAIITDPRLLLVDEMSLGLAPVIVQQMMPVVRSVADTGAAVIIVEQHVHLALDLADRAVVIANGTRCRRGAGGGAPWRPLPDSGGILRLTSTPTNEAGRPHTIRGAGTGAHHCCAETSWRAMTLRQRVSSAPSKIESTRASTNSRLTGNSSA